MCAVTSNYVSGLPPAGMLQRQASLADLLSSHLHLDAMESGLIRAPRKCSNHRWVPVYLEDIRSITTIEPAQHFVVELFVGDNKCTCAHTQPTYISQG